MSAALPDKSPCARICPTGAIREEEGTLLVDEEDALPACVDACQDNVFKIFSVEDLEEIKKNLKFTEFLNDAIKAYQDKIR